MKKYESGIHYGENRSCVELEASFRLLKTIHCQTEEYRDHMVEKLQRLQNEDFNRVLIPKFTYTVDGNDVTYEVDFIKGYGVGTYIPEFAQIVAEDVRDHKSSWTFTDYHMVNFMVEFQTNKIYAIDFQSYCYTPDMEKRRRIWDSNLEKDKVRMERIYNGKWNHARIRKKG